MRPGVFSARTRQSATPPDTAAAQLCHLASEMTGTCVGHSPAFPVLPAEKNQQLPAIPLLLKILASLLMLSSITAVLKHAG